jgi:hypothetical protein
MRDHVRIRGHHQALAFGRRQQRAILALPQVFVVEGAKEHLRGQLSRQAATRTVVHVDPAVL